MPDARDCEDTVTPYYERGGIVIYHGDARELLPTLEAGSVDLVLTDPPYLDGDQSAILTELQRVASRVVVTPGKIESFNWIRRKVPTWEYAWKCSGTSSLGGAACLHILFEPILAYGYPNLPLGSDLLDYPLLVDPMANGHPWPKPLRLFIKLLAHFSGYGETVCDPFLGSGTTAVAAQYLGISCIGIEIEERYCEIAANRLSQDVLPLTVDPIPQPAQLALDT